MTKELMELADTYASTYADAREGLPVCYREEARAAMQSAIESLQAENERLKREIQNQYRCIESHAEITQKAEAERDAIAAKLETANQSSAHWQHQFTELQARLVPMTDMQKQYAKRYRFAFIESPEWTYAVCKWDGSDWLPISHQDELELDAAIDAAKGGQHEDA